MVDGPAVTARPVGAPAPGAEEASAWVATVVELLLTVGHIDGLFHHREQVFVQQYLESVIRATEQSAAGTADERARLGQAWRAHFSTLHARLGAEVEALAAEVVPRGDGTFVSTKLTTRAVTLFRGLAAPAQAAVLELVAGMVHADGVVDPLEVGLYNELLGYFTAPAPAPAPAAAPAPGRAGQSRPLVISPPQPYELKTSSHPLLDPLEQTYSPHPTELQSQLARDYQLVLHAIEAWQRQRALGAGLLSGVDEATKIPAGARFLDDHVHVIKPAQPTELVVLGDLHGCYGCLKAALLQSDFIRRVWLHQWDPARYPDIKLVMLGDYIDRGRFSFDGVLRAALQLFVAMPDNVVLLRGNHEYFVWLEQRMYSGVHPAEALTSITPYVPPAMLEGYRVLFEQMPTSLVFDRLLFVHGGIPRDDTFAAKWRDLSSLNDPEVRWQMLWSDPVVGEHVPVELQRKNPRFGFGRGQFRAFMERTGVDVMIRGHEQIDAGFDVIYDLGDRLLLSLFSAGGHDNADLPEGAPYRRVTPMALTILHDASAGPPRAYPWPIAYQPFNYAPYNGFHRDLPLLQFRTA